MQAKNTKRQAHLQRPLRLAGPAGGRRKEGNRQSHGHNGDHFAYGCTRWCRHVVTGRIQAPKICTRNEECYHCAFDQMLDEIEGAGGIDAPAGLAASLDQAA